MSRAHIGDLLRTVILLICVIAVTDIASFGQVPTPSPSSEVKTKSEALKSRNGIPPFAKQRNQLIPPDFAQQVVATLSKRGIAENVAVNATRESGRPPYPILFVHGLDSSSDVWDSVFGHLDSRWGPKQIFEANLNADGRSTCTIEGDVSIRTSSLSDGSLFAVNFDLGSSSASPSNESAIIKQGRALKAAIAEIMDATGEEKIVLVGHSMGGLAIREYLQRRDPSGKPRWWLDPNHKEGHHVAKVVTYGTPHWGTNFSWENLVFPSARDQREETRPKVPYVSSEAVRDLRRSYENDPASGAQGRYLYGGSEGWSVDLLLGWENTDVNCDGDENDVVTGIAETNSQGFQFPLPKNISYTWLTSSCDGGNLFNPQECSNVTPGDGVVRLQDQFISSSDGQPYPVGLADTLKRSFYHSNEPDDISGVLRGLDEPDSRKTAYQIPQNQQSGHFIDGILTAQPSTYNEPLVDRDVYSLPGNDTGSLTFTLQAESTDASPSVILTENGHPAAFSPDGQSTPLQFTASTAAGAEQTAYLSGAVSGAEARRRYSFRIDTQKLQHFSYEPRHGSFEDTTEQGFATLFVPRSVPTIENDLLEAGDEIGVFTPDGVCVGASVWRDTPNFITAFGDEEGGLARGDSLHVRLWDQSTDTEYFVSGTLSGNDGLYEPGTLITATDLHSSSVLPVEIASFEANLVNGNVSLRWKTLSEMQNASFEVQRKAGSQERDEAEWIAAGQVEGAGTTSQAQSYHFVDTSIPYAADALTYRLKQIDTDGTTSFSEEITITQRAVKQIQLVGPYPNPSSNQVTVRFAIPSGNTSHDMAHLRLYDALGRKVRTVRTSAEDGRHELQLSTRNLSSGVYFLRLEVGSTVRTKQITVTQ